MRGILRLPAAFIAFIQSGSFGLLAAALLTEFTLVFGAAGGAYPAVGRFWLAAVGAEFSGIAGFSAAAGPGTAGLWLWLRFAAVGTELSGVALMAASAGPA